MRTTRTKGRGLTTLGIALAAVALIALAATPAVAQRGSGRMQGKVTDPEGNPVPGVEITATNPEMTPGTLTGTTDENGNWAIIGFARANWQFTFEAPGYIPHQVNASVSGVGRNPDMNITLQPATPTEGGAGVGTNVEGRELFEEGNTLFDAGDAAGALARWQEFAELNPEVYQVWFNIGGAHRALGDVPAAREAYERVLAEDPADTRANYALGELMLEEGNTEAAIPYFEKSLESSPDDPAIYYNVGELYFARPGGVEQAIGFYEQALAVDPSYLPAQKQIGFAYINAGNNEAAIQAFEKYVELAPPDDPDLALVQDVLAALKGGEA